MNPAILAILAFLPIVAVALFLVVLRWPAKHAMPVSYVVAAVLALFIWKVPAVQVAAGAVAKDALSQLCEVLIRFFLENHPVREREVVMRFTVAVIDRQCLFELPDSIVVAAERSVGNSEIVVESSVRRVFLERQLVVTDAAIGVAQPAVAVAEVGVRRALLRLEEQRHAVCSYGLAIALALEKAGENDIVLIAGKGHEDYQILGKQKIHFSDAEVVAEFFGVKK